MDLVSLPSADSMLAGVASSSSPIFTALLPLGLFGMGLIVGGLIVYALMHWIGRGITSVIHGGKERYD